MLTIFKEVIDIDSDSKEERGNTLREQKAEVKTVTEICTHIQNWALKGYIEHLGKFVNICMLRLRNSEVRCHAVSSIRC